MLIGGGKQQWALEYRKTTNDVPTLEDLRPFIGYGTNKTLPACPNGGTYIMGKVGESPECSYPGHSFE
jgi:hypothetical protein